MEFTNGDMSMLPTLMKFDNLIGDNNEWLKKAKTSKMNICNLH